MTRLIFKSMFEWKKESVLKILSLNWVERSIPGLQIWHTDKTICM